MITVERIARYEDIESIKNPWSQLLGRSDVDVIFLTPEWLQAWWRIYGKGREPYILVVKSGDEIIGIVPLMRTTFKRLGKTNKVIEFIGTPNTDYSDVISANKPEVINQMLRYLKDHPDDWTRIELTQIPERSRSLEIFRETVGKNDPLMKINVIESCSGFVYDGPESERANFTLKKSRTVKTAINVMQKDRGLIYERLQDLETCKSHLLQLFQLHINRWDNTATPSKFLDEGNRHFYFELLDTFMPSGNICFFVVKNGNIPVACSFNFEYKGAIYFYTLAINQFYKKRSPGQMLFVLQGESFVRNGFVLDYSRGAQEYKNLFANRFSHNYKVTIFSRKSEFKMAQRIEKTKAIPIVHRLLENKRFRDYKLKLARELGERGPLGLLIKLVTKVVDLARKYVADYREFYVLRFEGTPDLSIKPRIPVEVRLLAKEDIPLILTFYGVWEESPKHRTIIGRFEKKADCIAALHNGNIISLYWGLYHTDHHVELNLTLSPGPNEVVLSDALTSPIYRGMKIVPYLLACQLSDYEKRGIRAIVGVARANKPSRKALSNFDFKHIKTQRFLKILGVRLI
jgi:CelD/BcsL family acetyltransferase involved in cellulose biosynthesis